jgi:hypothetical protein
MMMKFISLSVGRAVFIVLWCHDIVELLPCRLFLFLGSTISSKSSSVMIQTIDRNPSHCWAELHGVFETIIFAIIKSEENLTAFERVFGARVDESQFYSLRRVTLMSKRIARCLCEVSFRRRRKAVVGGVTVRFVNLRTVHLSGRLHGQTDIFPPLQRVREGRRKINTTSFINSLKSLFSFRPDSPHPPPHPTSPSPLLPVPVPAPLTK